MASHTDGASHGGKVKGNDFRNGDEGVHERDLSLRASLALSMNHIQRGDGAEEDGCCSLGTRSTVTDVRRTKTGYMRGKVIIEQPRKLRSPQV